MDEILSFYNTLSFYLIVILVFVTYMLAQSVLTYKNHSVLKKNVNDQSQILEFIWTTIPSIVLVSIGVMSFTLLYSLDDAGVSLLEPEERIYTINVIGRQWFWTYDYYDARTKCLITPEISQTYLTTETEFLEKKWYGFRLLEVKPITLPKNLIIRILVTSADVLHSWAIPSLGLKIDAVPGRLNQILVTIHSGMVAYGQCSELCGANHAFMPIKANLA